MPRVLCARMCEVNAEIGQYLRAFDARSAHVMGHETDCEVFYFSTQFVVSACCHCWPALCSRRFSAVSKLKHGVLGTAPLISPKRPHAAEPSGFTLHFLYFTKCWESCRYVLVDVRCVALALLGIRSRDGLRGDIPALAARFGASIAVQCRM